MDDHAVTVVTTHIQRKRDELRKLQQAVAMIPQVEADLAALERTLTILRGDHQTSSAISTTVFPTESSASDLGQMPLPQLAYTILKEAGNPLSGDEILQRARTKGRIVNKASLLRSIYRSIEQKQRIFKLKRRGIFGLHEWVSQRPDSSVASPDSIELFQNQPADHLFQTDDELIHSMQTDTVKYDSYVTLRERGSFMTVRELYEALVQKGRTFKYPKPMELVSSVLRTSIRRQQGLFVKDSEGKFGLASWSRQLVANNGSALDTE
ncbi:MAG: hypothetical protein ACRERE_16945 [Candidatus Entotheonellia bacterium]